MPDLGRLALLLAGSSALYTACAGFWSYHVKGARLRESVRGAALAIAVALTASVLVLEYLLITSDFNVQAVYNHTDRALPLLFKMGALWGGDAGSVLFWAWLLSLYTAYAAWQGWPRERRLTPVAVPLLAALLVFFTGLSNLVVNPFRLTGGHPLDGVGLDPLLQNFVMTIHPPAMYIGLIGLAVPAAYLLAALWTRTPSRDWLPVVRRWTLFAWLFLSAAIVLGGMWAYMELGWGGYWAWDPVENASLMPWLTATAFLHALQIEERRGMFRWWTALLGLSSFLLTLVGTYITRSGVLKNSVHSFTGTGVGPYFVGLFWASVLVSSVVLILRRDQLSDKIVLSHIISKEALYLLLEMVLASLTVIVLVGTFYPVISKALHGSTVVLTVHFFNTLSTPLFVVLIGLMGIAPVVGWHHARLQQLWQRLWIPWVVGIVSCIAVYQLGFQTLRSWGSVGVVVFAMTSMLLDFARATRARQKAGIRSAGRAIYHTIVHNRRRYGGYVAHLAFLTIALGVIGSHARHVAVTRTLQPGQSVVLRGYYLRYEGLGVQEQHGDQLLTAHVAVSIGRHHDVLMPGLEFFPGDAQPVARVAIHSGVMKDLYLVLEGTPGGNAATIQIFINPMVSWIWMGMYGLVAGTLLALSAPAFGDAVKVRRWEWLQEERRRLTDAALTTADGGPSHD
ncbi:heme lyase CcmF/NrfE family subunit [Sulfobacillus sp. hq2]|uniref:heme lyase CcmF/NrfE family subunit n=1 Tax=Sulfobacillus TaxID=28033 RepID=UPI000CD1F4FB|nr:cytochrome c-type biogenesis CcmF C-terminal domain-containing protein [Sulfobacillus sp. hq2]POB10990.1 cytochrome C assembly protein [Sulfobacillus sp. hq2]